MCDDAGPDYWQQCDGVGCDEKVAPDELSHPAYDVLFCSHACKSRWMNHLP